MATDEYPPVMDELVALERNEWDGKVDRPQRMRLPDAYSPRYDSRTVSFAQAQAAR